MEPFTIQCSTCQSIIRVRNPKMIGQIVNCPKCNSMLQITKPEAHVQASGLQGGDGRQIRVESHRGVIDSSAMTKEAFAPEIEDEYRLAPTQSLEPEIDGLGGLVAPPKVGDGPTFQDPFLTQPEPLAAPPMQRSVVAASLPNEPNHIQLLAVRRTARRRHVLMVAVLGSSGVLLAGMLFVGFLYWYTAKPSATIAKNSTVANAGADQPKHVGPKREAEQELLDDPLAAAGVDPLAEPTSISTENDKTSTGASEKTTESSEEPRSISDAILNATSSPDAAQPDNAQLNPLKPNVLQPDASKPDASKPDASKPDDAKPDELNLSESNPKANEQVAAPNSVTAAELPEQLKKFQSILNTTIEPQFLEDQVIEKAPPTAKELGLSTGQDSKAIPPVDVSKQMKLAITGLIVPPGSVSNTVSQWVQFSGVPSVVDLDSFAAAGVDPHRMLGKILVSVETPLEQVAASIAKEIGVDSKVFENQFLAFQASETAIRERMPTSIKINDLVANNEQQQWLVKVLDRIWPEYEGKWIRSRR